MGPSSQSGPTLDLDGQLGSRWMLLVGVIVVFSVLKDAIGRITGHPVVTSARGPNRTELVFGISVLLRLLGRIGETATGRPARAN